MRSPLVRLLVGWIVTALGVAVAAHLVPGISYRSPGVLLVVVVVLSLLNAVLRPLLVLFTLPFVIFTLGLGLIVINALTLGAVAWLVDGFHVGGFWPAVGGSVVISLVSWVVHRALGTGRSRFRGSAPRGSQRPTRGDVIDIDAERL